MNRFMNIFFIFAFSKINLLLILNSTSSTELLLYYYYHIRRMEFIFEYNNVDGTRGF